MTFKFACHFCGNLRPEDKISILRRDISTRIGLYYGKAMELIRYCNDSQECLDGAKNVKLIKLKERK